MKKCSVLIAEDEKIERESIVEILNLNFKNHIHIIAAKHGGEALALYEEHLPEIVLMDINMPMLNGLEAIEKMKEFGKNSVYMILTSYDYFSYAQKAIQLDVEEFLLKPANATQIVNAVSKALSIVHTAYNERTQTSMLMQKYNELRPTMELQCLYGILSNEHELRIQEGLKQLNIVAKSGFCFVLRKQQGNKGILHKLKSDIGDLGYACLYGDINNLDVFFVISSQIMHKEEAEAMKYILVHHHLHTMEVGIGAIQNGVDKLYVSYVQAMNSVHIQHENELLIVRMQDSDEHKQIAVDAQLIDSLIDCILQQDERELRKVLHEYVMSLLMKSSDRIIEEVAYVLDSIVEKLEKKHAQVIDRSLLPIFFLQEEQKYQNLEVQLFFIFNTLFRLQKNTSYQQSNQLVKKALIYIEKNYHKPISLNDVAKELKITPVYVSKILKQYNDKNFTDLVSEYRIEDAKRSLREGKRVKEVAFSVGFQSQSYFAKTFRKIVGLTPTDYQNMFM